MTTLIFTSSPGLFENLTVIIPSFVTSVIRPTFFVAFCRTKVFFEYAMFFWNSSRALTGSFALSTSYFLFTSVNLEEAPYFSFKIEANNSFVSISSLSMERMVLETSMMFSRVFLTEEGAVS